jgi:hypothetical protein
VGRAACPLQVNRVDFGLFAESALPPIATAERHNVRKRAVGGEPFAGGRDKQTAIVATAARAAPIARRRLRLPN